MAGKGKAKILRRYYWGYSLMKKIRKLTQTQRQWWITLAGIGLVINYIIGLSTKILENLNGNEWGYKESLIGIIFNPLNIVTGFMNTFSSTSALIYAIIFVVGGFGLIIARDSSKQYEYNRHNFGDYEVSTTGTYGTAHFAIREEIEELLNITDFDETEDFMLGVYDEEEGEVISMPLNRDIDKKANNFSGHVGVLGSSGAGKSTRFLIQNIVNTVLRGDSMLITDPKGEIASETANFAKMHGYKVRFINTVDPKKSDGWDMIGEIIKSNPKDNFIDEYGNLDPDYYTELSLDVQSTTDMIFRVTGGNTSDNGKSADYFEGNERVLFRTLLWAVLQELNPNYPPTIESIYRILTEVEALTSDQKREDLILENPLGFNRNHQGYHEWVNFCGISPVSQRASAVSSLINRLSILSSEYVRKMLSSDEIDLLQIANEKCVYYLIMSDTDSTFEVVTSSFFMFAFNRWQKEADASLPEKRLKQRILLYMEEAPNIGYIPDFDKKISVFRSRGINIVFIAQALPQLMRMFPQKDYDTILSNFGVLVLLKGNDKTTNDYFSQKAGTQTIINRSISDRRTNSEVITNTYNSGEFRESRTEGKRNLINPEEIQQMEFDDMIVFAGSLNPMMLKKMNFDALPESKYLKENKFDIRYYEPDWYTQFMIERETRKGGQKLKREIDNGENIQLQTIIEAKTKEYLDLGLSVDEAEKKLDEFLESEDFNLFENDEVGAENSENSVENNQEETEIKPVRKVRRRSVFDIK